MNCTGCVIMLTKLPMKWKSIIAVLAMQFAWLATAHCQMIRISLDHLPKHRSAVPSHAAQAADRQYFSRMFKLKYGRLNAYTSSEFMGYLDRTYAMFGQKHRRHRYVGLTLCWKIAAAKGWAQSLPGPLIAICWNYKVSPWKLLARACKATFPNLQDHWDAKFLMQQSYHWGRQAMHHNAYPPARMLLATSFQCAQALNNAWYLRVIPPLSRRLIMLQAAYNQHLADEHDLRMKPDDAAALARTAVYCWLMSRASDAQAKGNAAAQHAAYPSLLAIQRLTQRKLLNAAAAISLGDLWWQLPARHHLLALGPLAREKAIKIYRQAACHISNGFAELIHTKGFRSANRFIIDARRCLKRVDDPHLKSMRHACKGLQIQVRILHGQYAAAVKTLAALPTNPSANQQVGEYTCFVAARWHTGLPYLEHSRQPGLANTAHVDAADPQAPARQIALGNQWWALSSGYHGLMKNVIRRRAIHWYQQALAKLSPGGYATVRERVATMAHAK